MTSEEKQAALRARLTYWAEPERCYFVPDLHLWQDDPDILPTNRQSIGYLPVYETEEVAAEEHPGCEIRSIIVVDVDQH